jgi:ubiquinone/menaquinone biosynthesis C-methylase UbiE
MQPKSHWERLYRTKRPTEVSWYQPEARISAQLIKRVAPDTSARIIDVGGGASTLVDGLLDAGYDHVTVLDFSAVALEAARSRLGLRAKLVTWLEADALEARLPAAGYDVWHDRAVFHFLTEESDRRRYVERTIRAVRPGGHVIVATFSDKGPTHCSGLDVVRYAPEQLHAEFGSGFTLLESTSEDHVTPAGTIQAFVYCLCRTGF